LQRLDDLLAAEPSAFMNGEAGAGMGAGMGGGKAGAGGRVTQMGPSASSSADSAAGADDRDSKLKIVEEKTKSGSTIKVQNLEEIPVKSAEEVFHHISKGISKRATAETACNAQSSRSHCVFTLTITTREVEATTGEEIIRVGKLNLVDLAGSECVGRSGAKDIRAREAGNINQSLLTLGRVITALVDRHPHIPYRDSKLTRLLQDSLGGRTKTCIIATLSPAAGCVEESLSTLEYANRAKNIKNKPEANTKMEKRAVLKEFNAQLAMLQQQLLMQQKKDGGLFMSVEDYNALHSEVKALKYELEEVKGSNAAQEKEISQLKESIDKLQSDLEEWQAQAEQRARELQLTCEQLEQTKEELAEEQVSHHESKAVIFSRDLHQSKLAKQTLAMADTLKVTVSDVALLHGKVARANAVFANNRAAVSSYVSSLSSKLGLLMNESQVHTSTQVQALEGVSAALLGAQDRCSKESSDMIAGVKKLQGDLAVYTKAVSQASSGVEGEVSKQCNAASDASASRLASIKEEQLMALARSVEGALGTMAGMLSSHSELISRWSSSAASSLEECKSLLSSFSSEQSQSLKAIRAGIEEQEAETQAALYHQKQAIQQLLAERNEATQKATEGMIASLTSALRQFATDSQQQNENGFSGVLAKVAETSRASRNASLAAGAGIGAAATRLEQFSGKMSATLADGLKHNGEFTAQAHSGQQQISTFAGEHFGRQIPASITAIGSSFAKASDAVSHDFSTLKGTVAAYSTRAQLASTSAQERFTKSCEALVAQGEKIPTAVSSVVATTVVSIDGDIIPREHKLFSSSNGEEGSIIRTFVGDVAGLTAATFTAASSSSSSSSVPAVKELAITGTTPAKRDYQAPSASSLVLFNESTKGAEVRSRFREAVATSEGASAAEAAESATALFASPMKSKLVGIATVPATPAPVSISTVAAATASQSAFGSAAASVQISKEASAALQQILQECNVVAIPAVETQVSPVVTGAKAAVVAVSLDEDHEEDEEQEDEHAAESQPSPASSSVTATVEKAAVSLSQKPSPAAEEKHSPAETSLDSTTATETEDAADDDNDDGAASVGTSTDPSINALAGLGSSTTAEAAVVVDEEELQPAAAAPVAAPAAAGTSRRTRQIASTTSSTSTLSRSGRLAAASAASSSSAASSAAGVPPASATGRPRRVIGVGPVAVAAAPAAAPTAAVPAPLGSSTIPTAPITATAAAAPTTLKLRASIAGKDGAKISLGIGVAKAAAMAAAAATGAAGENTTASSSAAAAAPVSGAAAAVPVVKTAAPIRIASGSRLAVSAKLGGTTTTTHSE
jgi:kinesin family member 11